MRSILLITTLLVIAVAAWLSGSNELQAATIAGLQAPVWPETGTALQEQPTRWAQAGSAVLFIAIVIWRNARLSR
jgi:hypothetical protein